MLHFSRAASVRAMLPTELTYLQVLETTDKHRTERLRLAMLMPLVDMFASLVN
jgi:hypothetical protein